VNAVFARDLADADRLTFQVGKILVIGQIFARQQRLNTGQADAD